MLLSSGLRTLGLAAALSLAFALPAQQASAQDPLIGGLLGGAAGAIIGGAAGGGRGAAIGAIIGGASGAIIASEGQRRRGSYYYWRNGCYLQRGDGSYMRVAPDYCGGPAYAPPQRVYAPPPPPPRYYAPPPRPAYDDAVAYCMQRYRSYDPRTGTYINSRGEPRYCP